MFNVEDSFVDIQAIEQGRWVELGADFPGVEIEVVGLTSKAAKRYHEQMERTAPRADRLANGQLTPDAKDRILRTVVTQKCVRDWKGLASGGKLLPFSVEKLSYFMNEPQARRLAAAIINAIVDLEGRKLEAQEEVKGNS